jgi:tRNA(Ile2) C34 agmatinyltransferase TiaS
VGYFLRGEEYSAQVEYFVERIRTDDRDNVNSFASAQATDEAIEAIRLSGASRMAG